MDLNNGLNQDMLFQDQPLETYRWAKNWVVNLKQGTIQTEPGFDYQFKLRDNLYPIGVTPTAEGLVIFSCNDDGSDCEVGLYTETGFNEWFIDGINSIQVQPNTYIPVLNNSIVQKLNNDMAAVTGLNFSPKHQIKGVYRFNNIRELEVAFTDWYNIPRVMYLGDFKVMRRHYDPYDVKSLGVFQDFLVADVNREIVSGGSIPSGSYFVFYRYQNDDLSTTQVVVVDRPVYITTKGDGKPATTYGDSQSINSGKAIRLKFENLDTAFPYVQIGLFRPIDNKVVVCTSQQINGPTIPNVLIKSFAGDGTNGSGDLEGGNLNILVQEIKYIKAKTVATQGSRLYFGNLVGNDSLTDANNISQKYINSAKVEWVLDLIDTQEEKILVSNINQKENIKSYNNYYGQNYTNSFQAGEVYAFFTRARFKDGSLSPWFHIPGPEPKPFEMLIVPPELTSNPYTRTLNPTDKIVDIVNAVTTSEGKREFENELDIIGSEFDAQLYQLRDTISYTNSNISKAFSQPVNGDKDSVTFGYWENQGEDYSAYFLPEDLEIWDAEAYANGFATKKLTDSTSNVRHHRFPSNFWINNAFHTIRNSHQAPRDTTFRQYAQGGIGSTHNLYVNHIPILGIKFIEPFLPTELANKVDYWEVGYTGRDNEQCTVISQDLALFPVTRPDDQTKSAAVMQNMEGEARSFWSGDNFHNPNYPSSDSSDFISGGEKFVDGIQLKPFIKNKKWEWQYVYHGENNRITTSLVPGYYHPFFGESRIYQFNGGISLRPKSQLVAHPDVIGIPSDNDGLKFSIDYVSYEVFLGRRVVVPDSTPTQNSATQLGKYPDLGEISYIYPEFMLPKLGTQNTVSGLQSLEKPEKNVLFIYDETDATEVKIVNNVTRSLLGESPYTPEYAVQCYSDSSMSSISLNRKVDSKDIILLSDETGKKNVDTSKPATVYNNGSTMWGYGTDTKDKISPTAQLQLNFSQYKFDRFPYLSPELNGRSYSMYGGVSLFREFWDFDENRWNDVSALPTSNPYPNTRKRDYIDGYFNQINQYTELLGSPYLSSHSCSDKDYAGYHQTKHLLCTYRKFTKSVYSGLLNSNNIVKAGESNKEKLMYFGDVFLSHVKYKFKGLSRSCHVSLNQGTKIELQGGTFIGGASPVNPAWHFGPANSPDTFGPSTSIAFYPESKVSDISFFSTSWRNLNYRDNAKYTTGYPSSNEPNPLYEFKNNYFPKTETSLKTLDSALLAGKYPFRVIWGEIQGTDAKINNWRKFKSTNLYEMDKVKGEVVNLQGYDEQLLIHTERALWITRPAARIDAQTSSSNYAVVLGTGDLFNPAPQEAMPDPLGIGGTQHQFSCVLSPLGYTWTDANTGRIYLYRKDSALLNLGQLGLTLFFEQYANVSRNDFSGDRGSGISAFTSWYDPFFKRLLIGYNREGITYANQWELNKETYDGGLEFNPYTVSMAERGSEGLSWTSFHDYIPTIGANTLYKSYSFKGQELYKHNSQKNVNKFYRDSNGNQQIFNSTIDIVFNTTAIQTKNGIAQGGVDALKLFQSFKWQTDVNLLNNDFAGSDINERFIETFDFATVYTTSALSERVQLTPFQKVRLFDGYWHFNSFRDNLNRNSYPSANRLENFSKFIGNPISGYQLDYSALDNTRSFNRRFVDQYVVLRLEASPLYTYQNAGITDATKQLSILEVEAYSKQVTK